MELVCIVEHGDKSGVFVTGFARDFVRCAEEITGRAGEGRRNHFVERQSGPPLVLNGKPTYLSGSNLATYLQAIPASSIGKIELISMPSSRPRPRAIGNHQGGNG